MQSVLIHVCNVNRSALYCNVTFIYSATLHEDYLLARTYNKRKYSHIIICLQIKEGSHLQGQSYAFLALFLEKKSTYYEAVVKSWQTNYD